MKIGQLAKAVGCSVETIRFYEKKGLLPPPLRTAGNFRIYNTQHLERLSFICYCRYLDISLDEIDILLKLSHSPYAQQHQEINQLLDRHLKQVANHIHKLTHLRSHLLHLKKKYGNYMNDKTNFIQELQHSSLRFIGFRQSLDPTKTTIKLENVE